MVCCGHRPARALHTASSKAKHVYPPSCMVLTLLLKNDPPWWLGCNWEGRCPYPTYSPPNNRPGCTCDQASPTVKRNALALFRTWRATLPALDAANLRILFWGKWNSSSDGLSHLHQGFVQQNRRSRKKCVFNHQWSGKVGLSQTAKFIVFKPSRSEPPSSGSQFTGLPQVV